MEKSSHSNYESLALLASRSDIHNRAIGSIIGAFLGDAMGSVLEFSLKATDLQVKTAMKLSGGGVFELAPGQVTDDSELALSLAKALIVESYVLNLPAIAKSYREWYDSSPFDIGTTTSKAFKGAYINDKNGEPSPEKCYLQMKSNVITHNRESLSNGALMRITPLAVFCHQMQNFDDIEKAVQLENELTHANPLVHKANALYVFAIQQLIINEGNYDVAIEKVNKLLEKIILERSKLEKKDWEIVFEWIEDSKKSKDELIPAHPNEGFIRIAFTYAFSAFYRKTKDFLSGIKEILIKCGDTDTNACIYGGLIGAAQGFKSLPEDLVTKLLNCNYFKQNRPEFLHPKSILQILPKLIKKAPLSLIYRGVQLEYPLNNEKTFEKIKEKSILDHKFNIIIGCLLGSLFCESQEKIKVLKEKKSNLEENNDFFKKLIRSLSHLSFEGNLTYFIGRFSELMSKKNNIPYDYLIYAISLSICVFCSSNSFIFIKNTFDSGEISKTLGKDKEIIITFCLIIFSILNGKKRETIQEELLVFLEENREENKNYAIIQSWYQNYQLISNNEKFIDMKTTLIMSFHCLKMKNGLIFKKNIQTMKDEKYLKENLFIYGALAGAFKGLQSFEDEKVKEILNRPISPKYNPINLFYLICKVMNLKI